MNCKPGDMAKVIEPHFRHGAIVEVVRSCTSAERVMLIQQDPEWRAPLQIWFCKLITGSRGIDVDTGFATYLYPGAEAWFADAYLRPIRDPGEDAVDETLQRLPSPSRDEVMA